MLTVSTVAALREQVSAWRVREQRTGLVPTMGNLHAGHMALVREARVRCERLVVSIFVNPMQFGANEDLDAYPCTPEADARQLMEAGVDLLFQPQVREVYPNGPDVATKVLVPGLSEILCGAARPGHFAGVATVVTKLFNMVQPDVAVFGEKDYQQLVVIRRLTADLCLPVDIVGVPTVREPDGLAMSSRNSYLTLAERRVAPVLYQTLCAARDRLQRGSRDIAGIEREGQEALREVGMRPDYFSVRRSDDLAPAGDDDRALVVLAAAWLGGARLIDNVSFQR